MLDWRSLLLISSEYLGRTPCKIKSMWSWCSWTTFDRLRTDAGYWTAPLPHIDDLLDTHTVDGGSWLQPFSYPDLAHLIIPRTFIWEISGPNLDDYASGTHRQDVDGLSDLLDLAEIPHRSGPLALEVKLY